MCDPSHLRDIFDGKILSDFGIINGEPFLASSGSIGIILNIDWFQLFKHRQYSIGEIYLVILKGRGTCKNTIIFLFHFKILLKI